MIWEVPNASPNPEAGFSAERREELHRAAVATRAFISRLVATRAPLDVLHGMADAIQEFAETLAEYPQDHLYHGAGTAYSQEMDVEQDANADYQGLARAMGAAGETGGPFENSPVMGRSNPVAPPLTMQLFEDRVEGTVTFAQQYEGAPGIVHGGYVAAVLDELLGYTQALSGSAGMTGRLTIHYRSPTPLLEELRLIGTLDRVSGRKVLVRAEVFAGQRLCAEAEGLFISLDFERFLKVQQEASS